MVPYWINEILLSNSCSFIGMKKKNKICGFIKSEVAYMGISEACKEVVYLRVLGLEILNKMYTFNLFRVHRRCQLIQLCSKKIYIQM